MFLYLKIRMQCKFEFYQKTWRYSNYISIKSIYLKNNVIIELRKKFIKKLYQIIWKTNDLNYRLLKLLCFSISSLITTDMKKKFGLRKFNCLTWQQNGAPAHTENLVVNYFDRVFGTTMLSMKSFRGVYWDPHSP